jgi:very-short-patch-repair endonuclease
VEGTKSNTPKLLSSGSQSFLVACTNEILEVKYSEIKARATEFRKNPTDAEILLWRHLRNHKMEGFKFLRQHPIVYDRNSDEHFFFIPDFYCSAVRLAIELDGDIHKNAIERDVNRDSILNRLGIKVLRIKNSELKDMEFVLNRIKQALTR